MKKIPFNWLVIILFFFILGGYFIYHHFFSHRITKMEQLVFQTGIVKDLGLVSYNGSNALYFTTTETNCGYEVPVKFGCCYYPVKFENKLNKGDTIEYAIDKSDLNKAQENVTVHVYSLKKGQEIFADANGILEHEKNDKGLIYGGAFWGVGVLLFFTYRYFLARKTND